MIVGILTLHVSVFDAMTLKDKRRVIKSLKDRISSRYNVSIAEVDHNDSIRSCLLAVAMVANEGRFVDSTLQGLVDFVRKIRNLTLVDYTIETV